MAGHDIIVIGASAGGVEALAELAASLPLDLNAAVFVVVHFPTNGISVLPSILSRRGPLRAVHPRDGDPIRPGTIYAAPPDCHLLVDRGTIRLGRGPRENGHRPAADPLFRSAAAAYGPRVVGVVLTGNLDDGTAGLLAVRRRGGVTVAQDPAEALYPGMPGSAIENVTVDHVVRLAELGPLLVRLAAEPVEESDPEAGMPGDEQMEIETDVARLDLAALQRPDRPGVPSGYACPECHGVLWEIHDGEVVRFRCRVGHAYGAETLLAEQTGKVEAALWTALQALKERAALSRRMAGRLQERGHEHSARRFAEQAADAEERASVIRDVLSNGSIGGEAVEL